MELTNLILITAAVLTNLLAGIFLGYAISVNWGLQKLRDIEYIKAMQFINIVIINPIFFLTFIGPVIFLPLATFLHFNNPNSLEFGLLLISSILYIVGCFGVTGTGNVPLNNQLAIVDTNSASENELKEARMRFENPWNRLHIIRTIASTISGILVIIVCIL